MTCAICRIGDTHPGQTTVTLERDQTTLVVRGVPAAVCGNCGEEYVDGQTSIDLLDLIDRVARAGVQIEVREYVAA